MINSYTIVYLLSNMIRIYAIFLFTTLFFDRDKKNRMKEFLAFSLYFLINSACYLLFKKPVLNVITNLVPYFAITFLYHSKVQIKVISTGLILGINILWDGIAVLFAQSRFQIFFNTGLVTAVLVWLTEAVVKRFLVLKSETDIAVKRSWTIAAIPSISIVLAAAEAIIRFGDPITIFTLVGLLVINCFALYMYERIIKTGEEVCKKELILQQNAAYEYQFNLVRSSQKEVRLIQHDLKNHLFLLMQMIKNGRYHEAEQYINRMLLIDNARREYVISGNPDIDSILNYKLYEIANIGTEIETDVSIPQSLKIKSFYLNVIFSNLLDNALEALKKCEIKKLKVTIKLERGVVYIIVKNTYTGEVEIHEDNLVTTKKDKAGHGIGLKSVKNALDKYNGTIKYCIKGGEFTVYAALYNDF